MRRLRVRQHVVAAAKICAVAAAVMAFLAIRPDAAEARTRVSVGIGIGVPLYAPPPSYGYYGYRPHPYWGPRAYYYGPPAVVVAPPPPAVVYAPPPSAAYAPPPPVAAAPVSPPYVARNGLTCREYQSQITIGGRIQPSHGTACLQPDGSWRLMN
jgi:hypothetical protein